ncbi:NUDIX hydrolase [Ornithinimicrobium panacihumi]|uniref:NUDIX hydrolase n=1 Tax=Ornithinimicrobium panacihumi TaxID=2008449 RepID=UPI003F8C2C08
MSSWRDFPMPELLVSSARGWLGTPEAERTAAAPKPSSTVMLLREASSGEGVEVFVLRRASSMPFAPGMIAFPGGGVDARDADPDVPWAGPSPQEWAGRLGTEEAVARELVIAAAREVFEECGVLLAGPDAGSVAADLTDLSWGRERAALLDRRQSFGEMLTRLDLVLRTDLLALRAHWTTPLCEPRRYDTRFFAARMPQGQVADDLSSEAERVEWATPQALLRADEEGREILLPPTRVMVEQLALVGDLDAWLDRASEVRRVMPWPVEHSDRLWMRAPLDADGNGLRAGVTT